MSDRKQLDLDGYLTRIGFDGPRKATLETLCELHRLHPLAIPFENLDPFLGCPVSLEPPAIEAKLVHGGRGGYCFEQNLLFWWALEAIGFRVSGKSARVLWNQAEDAITPRSHMLLRVEADDAVYIADVGFGGVTLTAPLRFETDFEQQTPHETFRIRNVPRGFLIEAWLGENWKPLYQFDLAEQFPVDYVAANYYLSTCEESHFRNGLMVAKPSAGGGRYTLLNSRLTTRMPNEPVLQLELKSAVDAVETLADIFQIDVPDRLAFETAWGRLA